MSTCKHYCVTCGKHADVDGLICGDCGEESAAAHTEQLAAERAKVALAVEALQAHELYCESDKKHQEVAYNNFARLKYKALAALQSSDALAEIRREVARECAEILKGVEDRYSKHSFPMHPADVAAACAYVIRANFGVTE